MVISKWSGKASQKAFGGIIGRSSVKASRKTFGGIFVVKTSGNSICKVWDKLRGVSG